MYFYQVQTQPGACKLHRACFVVCTADDLYFEQNTFDKMCLKEKHIFYTAILPELVGKFYTRLPKSDVVIAARNLPDSRMFGLMEVNKSLIIQVQMRKAMKNHCLRQNPPGAAVAR